jgi:hypothetical protein
MQKFLRYAIKIKFLYGKAIKRPTNEGLNHLNPAPLLKNGKKRATAFAIAISLFKAF